MVGAANLRWLRAGLVVRLVTGVVLPGVMHMRTKCASSVAIPGRPLKTGRKRQAWRFFTTNGLYAKVQRPISEGRPGSLYETSALWNL